MATSTDTAPASRLRAVLGTFFETKTACDVEGTMAYFASHAALKGVFDQASIPLQGR